MASMAASDADLTCNIHKCRKKLTETAWVTSCSHIFCEEDAAREFENSHVCPACNSSLAGKYDIVRLDLRPSEQVKSMMLAGLKPETILEISSRAIAFWTYQTYQNKVYREYAWNKAKEGRTKLEQYYEKLIAKIQQEIKSITSEESQIDEEIADMTRRLHDATELNTSQLRQYNKLQATYDAMKRDMIKPSLGRGSLIHPPELSNVASAQENRHNIQFQRILAGGSIQNIPQILRQPPRAPGSARSAHSGNGSHNNSWNSGEGEGFVLKPFPTPQHGIQAQKLMSDCEEAPPVRRQLNRSADEKFGSRFSLRFGK